MKTTFKKFFAALLMITVTVFSLPFGAQAKDTALGSEMPYLYCVFEDENGNPADGNALASGKYLVGVVLEGMKTSSVFQFTADYNFNDDLQVIEDIEVLDTYSTTAPDMRLGGVRDKNDGTIVVVLASANDSSSAIDETGTSMALMSVEISCEETVDFGECFRFNTNPDLTFAEASYSDGIEDAYVLDMTADTSYNKYPMTSDESPELAETTYTVSGIIAIADSLSGHASENGVGGITVETKMDDKVVSDITDENGRYSLQLYEGDYNISIYGDTTIDRVAHLSVIPERAVDSIITADTVGIVLCDYNKDTVINQADKITFLSHYQKDSYLYCDFNCDGIINSADKISFYTFYNKSIQYDEINM